MSYDANNVFAKILRGELPAEMVYDDADTFAFMDIMPRCDGHTLVIPKTPARNILDASPEQLARGHTRISLASTSSREPTSIAQLANLQE